MHYRAGARSSSAVWLRGNRRARRGGGPRLRCDPRAHTPDENKPEEAGGTARGQRLGTPLKASAPIQSAARTPGGCPSGQRRTRVNAWPATQVRILLPPLADRPTQRRSRRWRELLGKWGSGVRVPSASLNRPDRRRLRPFGSPCRHELPVRRGSEAALPGAASGRAIREYCGSAEQRGGRHPARVAVWSPASAQCRRRRGGGRDRGRRGRRYVE